MPSANSVIIVGHITRDPEVKTVGSAIYIPKFLCCSFNFSFSSFTC